MAMSITRWALLTAAILLLFVPPSADFLESTVEFGFDPQPGEDVLLNTAAIAVGGLIVLFFFWSRFNEWPSEITTADVTDFLEAPPSYCTTWGRYQIYHIFYVGVASVIYLLIVRFPFLVEFLTNILHQSSDELVFAEPGSSPTFDITMSTTAAAGYAAAFMIGVWTSLPVLGERKLRTYCHESAAVPREARSRISQFHSGRSAFVPDKAALERLMRSDAGEFLSERPFRGEDVHRWSFAARAEYMWMQIEAETNDRFTRARARHSKELRRVRSEMGEIRTQALRLIEDERRAIQELTGDAAHSSAEALKLLKLDQDEAERLPDELAAAAIFKQDFKEREQALLARYRRIYSVLLRIMVTTTLAAFRSEKERRSQIERLGFRLPGKSPELIPAGAVPVSIAVGFMVIGFPTFLFWLTAGSLRTLLPHLIDVGGASASVNLTPVEELVLVPKVRDIFFWSLIGAIMHTLAICAAFVMVRGGAEDVVEFRTRRRTALERWDAMATGFIGGFFINVVFMMVVAIAAGRPETIAKLGPWALVPAVTAALLALHLVSPEKSRLGALTLAIGQGVATATMAVLVTFFVGSGAGIASTNLLVFGIYAAVTAGLTGIALGVISPLLAAVGEQEDLEGATPGAGEERVEAHTLLSPG
jgi:hypothetical protein